MAGTVAQAQVRQNMMQRKLMMDRINELGDEIQVLSCQRAQEEQYRDIAVQETNTLKEEYKKITQQIEVGKILVQRHTNEIHQFNKEVEEKRKELLGITDALDIKVSIVKSLDNDILILSKEKDAIDGICIVKTDILNKLNDECLKKKDDIIQLNKEIENTREVLGGMDDEIMERKSKLDAKEKVLADTKEYLDQYRKTLNIYTARLNKELKELGHVGNIPTI